MNKQQLASKIWASANKMRSKIEANEYKDYILGFIFYKFLSDKDNLISQVDRPKAKAFIESQKGEAISPRSVTAEIYSLLRRFLIGNYEGLFTPSASFTATSSSTEINIGTNIEHADTVIIHSTPTE